ncbi:hypothetical protein FDUTEX481_07871 [Tolypothrix sp. PCC 7601]|nr:hypothetical protein FDUTEX481_07871 [Tolypothrix sp. PCC 7601]
MRAKTLLKSGFHVKLTTMGIYKLLVLPIFYRCRAPTPVGIVLIGSQTSAWRC